MVPLLFLILFPFLAALGILVIPTNLARKAAGYGAAALIIAASLYLIYANFTSPATYIEVGSEFINELMLAGEVLMALYIIAKSYQFGKNYPLILAGVQTMVLLYVELGMPHNVEVQNNLFLDQFSLLMTFVIGVIGTLICVYAFDYMRDFHAHHKEVKDRRGPFFFILFAFLGAMFGLVFSNNLLWLYFFWEVTTICSFWLIKYTKTQEATDNAFRALSMNLFGSLAFIVAIYFLAAAPNPISTISEALETGSGFILLPLALIGFAGITKSAQLPFSSWLVGAMVAPTPVSALLHSSTMVKAGVYILMRLAPLYQGTTPGMLLSLLGGSTFLLASGIAISQSNAKKVLAYSTIANLGLIVACAGVGTYEAMWAGMLLIVFHALAKSLMFLSVGTVEHRIGSRDIEDMEGLIARMPRLAFAMLIGIAGMFLTPFGMLFSKWAVLKALIDANPLLVGMVAFGSGITVFFWAKWMGKIITQTRIHKIEEDRIGGGEWAALYALIALTISMSLLFPAVSSLLIEPFVSSIYKMNVSISQDNVMIMLLMMGAILAMPFMMLYYGRERKHLPHYMGGRPTTPGEIFAGSAGLKRELAMSNYYLEAQFGEKKLMGIGVVLCAILMAAMLLSTGSGLIA